ncbi:hypothetical protein AB0M28_27370 [Streptomyces sp. NPDC051940]|uniref:hypothetical protein n=1 Tax=Streptomyces sp. NPDC051940 TaxID=3155675 RepID=UPI00343DE540
MPENTTRKRDPRLTSGPGRLIVWLYAVVTVGAISRSAVQLSTNYDEAPLAYTLSALAGLVYLVILVALVRGSEGARRLALVCCTAELVGVLTVGTWTLADPERFPDQTVWSDYGMGYIFIPLLLPVTGLLWLRRSGRESRPESSPA